VGTIFISSLQALIAAFACLTRHDSEKRFIETLEQLRNELDSRLAGHVVMPDHFHILVWPSKGHSPSSIVGRLKQRRARYIIESLKVVNKIGVATC
jgi:REP element-mobilizing transposase RayT